MIAVREYAISADDWRSMQPEIENRIAESLGTREFLCSADYRRITVTITDRWNVIRLTFDMLDQLHIAFGTRLINLGIKEGFAGSDVTPATSDELLIQIDGWSLPAQEKL